MCWQDGHLYLHTHTRDVSTKASKSSKYSSVGCESRFQCRHLRPGPESTEVTNESNPASFEGGKCCSLWCHQCQQRCQCQQLQGCGIGRKPCSRGCSCCKCLFPTGSSANTWCFPSVPWLKHFQTFGCWRNLGEVFESTGFNIKICSSFSWFDGTCCFPSQLRTFRLFQVLGSEAFSNRVKAPFGGTGWRCSAYVWGNFSEISLKVVNFQNLVCKTCTFVRTSLPIDWGFCPRAACGSFRGRYPWL